MHLIVKKGYGNNELANQVNAEFSSVFAKRERRALSNSQLKLRTESFWMNPSDARTIPFNYGLDRSNIFTSFPLVEGNVLLTDAQDYEKKEVRGQLP